MALVDEYSKEELELLVEQSFSFKDLLAKLGYGTYTGKNYETVKKRLNHYNISTAHFTYSKPRPMTNEEIFINNSTASQNTVKRAILKQGLIPYKCEQCGLLPFWNNKPLVLTLDHIDGNHFNNQLTNLRWLCPNCDRQQDTFGFKNKIKKEKNKIIIPRKNYEGELK